ncbi:hypothetical protein [Sphingomonas sp. G-3-2-10]|uniref:hypothetical protein n=1 Tax=Sphingomonas sp. G-3-2-10 TaxID=2728838 RepID=UPI00146D0449|nr:hypothetical protein [Sphingomonas sp. G-3-2-10]NML08069.1 hypothetical protein [Sphingomonas sp. G-3-2-10]
MSEIVNHGVAKAVRSLYTAELNADANIESYASLIVSIARGRQATGLPFGATQAALDEAGQAIACSLQGRRHLVKAHASLLMTVQAHDIDITGHGDIFPWCPNASGDASLIAPMSVTA